MWALRALINVRYYYYACVAQRTSSAEAAGRGYAGRCTRPLSAAQSHKPSLTHEDWKQKINQQIPAFCFCFDLFPRCFDNGCFCLVAFLDKAPFWEASSSWSRKVENAQILPCAGFIWWFSWYIYVIKKYFFCFEFEHLKVQRCWFTLCQWIM